MKVEGRKHPENAGIDGENNMISTWLHENGDPAIRNLVEKNLAIANKISDILKQKDMRPADLAVAMGKQRSEISKWLSGTHTFSMKTITKIESVLEEEIVHVEPIIKNVYWTTLVSCQAWLIKSFRA